MTVLIRLGLGLGLGFVVLAPIVVGFVYEKSFNLNTLLNVFVLSMIWMGFCGVFSSLLNYMLPRKRAVAGEVVDDDSDNTVVEFLICVTGLLLLWLLEMEFCHGLPDSGLVHMGWFLELPTI